MSKYRLASIRCMKTVLHGLCYVRVNSFWSDTVQELCRSRRLKWTEIITPYSYHRPSTVLVTRGMTRALSGICLCVLCWTCCRTITLCSHAFTHFLYNFFIAVWRDTYSPQCFQIIFSQTAHQVPDMMIVIILQRGKCE